MAVPEDLMAILVCPQCRGRLEDRGDRLVCVACRLAYPVQDDIPIMLPEEARPLEDDAP